MNKKRSPPHNSDEEEEEASSYGGPSGVKGFFGLFGVGRGSGAHVRLTRIDTKVELAHGEHGLYSEHLKKVIAYIEYLTLIVPTEPFTSAFQQKEGKPLDGWTIYKFLQDVTEFEYLVVYPRCRANAVVQRAKRGAAIEAGLYERLDKQQRILEKSAVNSCLRQFAWYVNTTYAEETAALQKTKHTLESLNRMERRMETATTEGKAKQIEKNMAPVVNQFEREANQTIETYFDPFVDDQLVQHRLARHQLLADLRRYHRSCADDIEKALGNFSSTVKEK